MGEGTENGRDSRILEYSWCVAVRSVTKGCIFVAIEKIYEKLIVSYFLRMASSFQIFKSLTF